MRNAVMNAAAGWCWLSCIDMGVPSAGLVGASLSAYLPKPQPRLPINPAASARSRSALRAGGWPPLVGGRLIASLTGRGSLVPTAATGKNGRYPPRDRHGRTRSWPAGTLRTSGSGFCCCAMRWGGSPGCVDHWLRSVVGLGCVETLLVFIQLEIDLA